MSYKNSFSKVSKLGLSNNCFSVFLFMLMSKDDVSISSNLRERLDDISLSQFFKISFLNILNFSTKFCSKNPYIISS